MAKIHNPQDQDGILLINQTVFDGEVSARTEADTLLQSNIDAENARAEAAESTLQSNIDAEKERAMSAESALTTAIENEATRAQGAEADLNNSLEAETLRATTKEKLISAIIDGEIKSFSTDELTNGIYTSLINKPSAINVHNSIFPVGVIKSIEIPNANINSARYLSVKVVDGLSDETVDYTSTNSSTTKWSFDTFIKEHNVSENVYYKLVLSDAAGNSNNLYFGSIPSNNGNFANCGFGGTWPNPNSDLTVENGATGIARINIEFEPNLNDKIQDTAESIIAIINTLETKVDEHVEALDAVDASLLAKINEEKEARISADENINTLIADEASRAMAAEEVLSATIEGVDERLLNIEGKGEFITLEQQPTNTARWTAIEFKDNNHWVADVSNKRITSISFKVTNTVSTPHYLGVYDTRTVGSKILVATSTGTTWEANGDATFTFAEPIIIPGKFEIFLLNEPISGNHTSDLPAPNVFVESYVTEGTQNYRIPEGNWASNAKKAFYMTFNFVTDRLGTLEAGVEAHKADTVKHITAEERSAWNAKATVENVSDLESRINTTVQTLATKAEIADFVTEEVVDQKIATAEHHKPIFDLERNVDKVVFDIATSTEPQTVNLVLSEGKIFAGNVVVSNSVISAALGMINPGVDNMLNVNIGLQETPTSSATLYIIVDTICDDDICSNAQHVAEVIPVEIIVSEASE